MRGAVAVTILVLAIPRERGTWQVVGRMER